jgi:hypothetical protein
MDESESKPTAMIVRRIIRLRVTTKAKPWFLIGNWRELWVFFTRLLIQCIYMSLSGRERNLKPNNCENLLMHEHCWIC